jgi:DNA-binding transcriptional MerR regulator
MAKRARERTSDEVASDLLPISEVARLLDRSTETIRKWSQQVPPLLQPYRDGISKIRYFRRGDVLALLPQKE